MPVTKFTARPKETFTFGAWRYNIDLAKEEAARPRAKVTTFSTQVAAKLIGFIRINADHAKTVDLTCPILIATIRVDGKDWSLPIDGYHRIQRALDEGVHTLPAIVLSLAASNRCKLK